MKPPHHPTASGDRRLARLLMRALRHAGHDVSLASSHRTWRPKPEPLDDMKKAAEREIALLTEAYDTKGPPDLWFTYHLYHKAPDLIGPVICDRFSLPYCVCEASVAPKHAEGMWRDHYAATITALAQAHAVFFVNPTDRACVNPFLQNGCQRVDLKPFLEVPNVRSDPEKTRDTLIQALSLDPRIANSPCWIAVIGMMRKGVKSISYKLLSESIQRLPELDFTILIMGGGEAASEIRGYFKEDPRIIFLGAQSQEAMAHTLSTCDFAAWPSIGEAFGYGLLEAQAAGLAVASGENAGVASIVAHEHTGLLCPMGDADAFAQVLRRLINDPTLRRTMGQAARHRIETQHSLNAAADILDQSLQAAKAQYQRENHA